MKKTINLAGILFVLIGIYVIMTAATFPSISKDVPGPGFFPIILAGALIGLSLLLFNINRTQKYDDNKVIVGKKFSKTYMSIFATLVYIIILEIFGFIPCTIPFLVTMIYLFNYRNLKINIMVSSIITCVIYYVFNILLNVPLPEASIILF